MFQGWRRSLQNSVGRLDSYAGCHFFGPTAHGYLLTRNIRERLTCPIFSPKALTGCLPYRKLGTRFCGSIVWVIIRNRGHRFDSCLSLRRVWCSGSTPAVSPRRSLTRILLPL
jgi:hypothetical protein